MIEYEIPLSPDGESPMWKMPDNCIDKKVYYELYHNDDEICLQNCLDEHDYNFVIWCNDLSIYGFELQ